MRALVINRNRDLELVETSSGRVSPGWVRVDVAYCAICGSDLHLRQMPHLAPEGTILGHEFAGTITETSPEEERLHAGDRVTAWPKDGCRICGMCETGNYQLCGTSPWRSTALGLGTRAGAYAEQVLVPAHAVYPIPDSLPLTHACLTEPLSCCLHAIERGDLALADSVAILGGGTVGFLTAHALKDMEVSRLVVTEPVEQRRNRLTRTGIHAIDVPADALEIQRALGAEADVVIECTGSPTGLSEALSLVKTRGRVIAMGVSDLPSPLDSVDLVTKEVTIVASFAQPRQAFERALLLLAEGRIPAEELITDVVPLVAGVTDIMHELANGSAQHQVVLISPLDRPHETSSGTVRWPSHTFGDDGV